MEDKDLYGIPDEENSQMDQIEFELDEASPEMDQIQFDLNQVFPDTDEVDVLEQPELAVEEEEPVSDITTPQVDEMDPVIEENGPDMEESVQEADCIESELPPQEDEVVQEMSSAELGELVNDLECSVNELGEFVDKMNEIVNDEAKSESDEVTEEQKKEKSVQKTILSYLHDIAFGMVIILLLFMIVFRVVVVSGPSMLQTLQDGDCIVLLNSVFYREPKVGDIVVATKSSYKDGEPIIKRVIATEGQKVDIDFEKGIVYVDDMPLYEPYINTPTNLYEGVSFPLIVDKDCVFVMGDNRNDSKDSRSVEIGQIDRRELLGKALFLVIPGVSEGSGNREFSRIGALW